MQQSSAFVCAVIVVTDTEEYGRGRSSSGHHKGVEIGDVDLVFDVDADIYHQIPMKVKGKSKAVNGNLPRDQSDTNVRISNIMAPENSQENRV